MDPLPALGERRTPHVNFVDERLKNVVQSPLEPQRDAAHEFFLHLALNHTIVPERVPNESHVLFSSASPDEEALAYGAAHFGFCFSQCDNQVPFCSPLFTAFVT